MGWLWASATPAVKVPSPEEVRRPSSSTAAAPAASSASTSTTNTSSDPEIQKFFELFQNDESAKANPSSASPQSSQSAASSSSWFSLQSSSSSSSASRTATGSGLPSPDAPLTDPLAESLLPTDMSCRTAFDQAWACNSMGGQWNAVFRYGEMRSCSDQWDDFWFCMRSRSYSGEMREKLIREHYRGKERAKYGGGRPSSEDVWQSRGDKVAPGSVFSEPIE